MKKTFKNAEILETAKKLQKITGKFPVCVLFKIVKNKKAFTGAAQLVTDAKNAIIMAHSETGTITPDDPDFGKVTREIMELLETPQMLDIETFLIDEIEGDEMDVETMDAIADFIKADEQEV